MKIHLERLIIKHEKVGDFPSRRKEEDEKRLETEIEH